MDTKWNLLTTFKQVLNYAEGLLIKLNLCTTV